MIIAAKKTIHNHQNVNDPNTRRNNIVSTNEGNSHNERVWGQNYSNAVEKSYHNMA